MDPQAFGADIVAAVRSFLELELDPVLARLEAMEQRFAALPVPKDGKDADPQAVAGIVIERMSADLTNLRRSIQDLPRVPELPDVAGMIAEAVASIRLPDVEAVVAEKMAAAVASLPLAKVGKDADPDLVAAMISAEVAKLPRAQNGKDADPELIRQMVTEAVTSLPPAKDGKDADPALVKAAIAEHVQAVLAGWERPQDGKSVRAEELRPLVEEVAQRAIAAMPVPKDGKDGADVVDLLIDREGALVATLSNGKTKTLGPVVGKDADLAAIERNIAERVAAIPAPKNGADGLGFEDMTEELADDGRTVIRRYTRGDQVKEFQHSFAVVLDRGVFKDGSDYAAGDGVTWAGSFWIAQGATKEKPDTGKGWRLAVKRGRDGKDGVMKSAPKDAPLKVG